MKLYECDKCKTHLRDGPIGAVNFVEIEIQPSYAPINRKTNWELCKWCLHKLEQFLDSFCKETDAPED